MKKSTKKKDKIQQLLELDQITVDDINVLSDSEHRKFQEEVNRLLPELEGHERDLLIKKIEPIMDEPTKSSLWEINHTRIVNAIYDLMTERYRMPSKTEIAIQSGLSRPTVDKHLKEYKNHPLYKEQMDQISIIASKVMATVCESAISGDMRAAKLFFNIMGAQHTNPIFLNQCNNYIQINNTILSQDKIELLKPGQLKQIEDIVLSSSGQSVNK